MSNDDRIVQELYDVAYELREKDFLELGGDREIHFYHILEAINDVKVQKEALFIIGDIDIDCLDIEDEEQWPPADKEAYEEMTLFVMEMQEYMQVIMEGIEAPEATETAPETDWLSDYNSDSEKAEQGLPSSPALTPPKRTIH